jgi:hypothetical protein
MGDGSDVFCFSSISFCDQDSSPIALDGQHFRARENRVISGVAEPQAVPPSTLDGSWSAVLFPYLSVFWVWCKSGWQTSAKSAPHYRIRADREAARLRVLESTLAYVS